MPGNQMRDENQIMLSVAPRYAKSILAGAKAVELRRRAPRLGQGTRAWLYSTLPVGEVVALLTIDEVVEAPLQEIWEVYGKHAAIDREGFDAYFKGLSHGAALIIRDVQQLKIPVSLKELREHGAFHPPQFYKRLRADVPCERLSSRELQPMIRLAIG